MSGGGRRDQNNYYECNAYNTLRNFRPESGNWEEAEVDEADPRYKVPGTVGMSAHGGYNDMNDFTNRNPGEGQAGNSMKNFKNGNPGEGLAGNSIPTIEKTYIDENGKIRFNKIFGDRKKPSVRAKEKKLRQNRQLRKAIFPKNALMAMNELKGLNVSEFTFTMSEAGCFTAVVTVNGKQHEGKGSSKAAAKNAACESVLRDFVIAKMIQRPRLTKRTKNNSTASGNEGECSNDIAMETDDTQSVADSMKSVGPEEAEELPMVNIASFALYKLFSEWEREGYVVPELHLHEYASGTTQAAATPPQPTATQGAVEPAPPKKPPIRKELPKNWEHMHPATLLCMMRPGLTYIEYGSTGEKNNITHRLGVVVDGTEYVETGRSKKIARKNVAINVCNTLFGTNFSKEEATPGEATSTDVAA